MLLTQRHQTAGSKITPPSLWSRERNADYKYHSYST